MSVRRQGLSHPHWSLVRPDCGIRPSQHQERELLRNCLRSILIWLHEIRLDQHDSSKETMISL